MRIIKTFNGYKIWTSARDTYKWAHKSGNSWPCSTISDKRLFIEVDKGDLIDLAVNGDNDHDIDSWELSAFISDIIIQYDLKQETI